MAQTAIIVRIDYDDEFYSDQQLVDGMRAKFQDMASRHVDYGPEPEDKPVPIVRVQNP